MSQKVSEKQRQAIIAKMLNRGEQSAKSIAQETGVGISTLYLWLNKYGNMSDMTNSKDLMPKSTPAEKMRILITYHNLPEDQRGAFLRMQGLYLAQLETWEQNPSSLFKGAMVSLEEYQALKKKHYLLEKEVAHKDKALAEAAALILLKKKVQHHLGLEDN